MSSMWKQ